MAAEIITCNGSRHGQQCTNILAYVYRKGDRWRYRTGAVEMALEGSGRHGWCEVCGAPFRLHPPCEE